MTTDRLMHGAAAEVAESLRNAHSLSTLELAAALINALKRIEALEDRVAALSGPPTIEVDRNRDETEPE